MSARSPMARLHLPLPRRTPTAMNFDTVLRKLFRDDGGRAFFFEADLGMGVKIPAYCRQVIGIAFDQWNVRHGKRPRSRDYTV